MNKCLALVLALLFSSLAIASGPIAESDAGTYVLLGRDRQPTQLFYRLSGADGAWVMEGREPGKDWKNISCEGECQYRASSAAEIERYFPADWRAATRIACIQNVAQAFCRYSDRNDDKSGGYVVIALVTGKPLPMFVKRVDPQ